MIVDPGPGTVGDVMTPDPIIVTTSTPLAEVAQLLDRHGVSGFPVVDATGQLVGVISQTDLLHARTTEELWGSWPGLTARHLMSSPALTIGASATVAEAARTMEAHRVHRLVVVAPDGTTPIGLFSTTDLVRAMAQRVDQ